MLLGSERKLVMLSATGLSPSRVQHSTASPSSTTLVLLSHNPVFTVVSCLHCPMDSASSLKGLTYSEFSGIWLYFQLHEVSFRRFTTPLPTSLEVHRILVVPRIQLQGEQERRGLSPPLFRRLFGRWVSMVGLKGDSASSCSNGPLDPLPGDPHREPRRAADSNYRPCTIQLLESDQRHPTSSTFLTFLTAPSCVSARSYIPEQVELCNEESDASSIIFPGASCAILA
ncbi:hypothetical protein Tco_0210614 [Tanacetum coccineum]